MGDGKGWHNIGQLLTGIILIGIGQSVAGKKA
jgi:hypothetical protein